MAEKDFWMASGRFAVPEAAAWATQPYHMGVRVLVCADLFDQEAPYSKGLGLGVAVNRPPIPKTLYYAGTITKEFMKKGEVQVCFEVDKCKCNVNIKDIHRRARDIEGAQHFYVFRANTGLRLHKLAGCVWLPLPSGNYGILVRAARGLCGVRVRQAGHTTHCVGSP